MLSYRMWVFCSGGLDLDLGILFWRVGSRSGYFVLEGWIQIWVFCSGGLDPDLGILFWRVDSGSDTTIKFVNLDKGKHT